MDMLMVIRILIHTSPLKLLQKIRTQSNSIQPMNMAKRKTMHITKIHTTITTTHHIHIHIITHHTSGHQA